MFVVLLVLCALLYATYFLHLRADYPGVLPLVDWARYTDEGWYGGAALHHAQTGQWFTPNGFNPAVALPVWPLVLRAWFALTGVGMMAARVLVVLLFGAGNVLLYALLRPLTGRVLAVMAVLLTLADPFSYGFDRLAVPEPLLVLLFLLAMWVARGRATGSDVSVARSCGVGLLLVAMVLTKTTAVLLAPAVLYLLWQAGRRHRHDADAGAEAAWHGVLRRAMADRAAFAAPAMAASVAVAVWLLYFVLLVRPHHVADFHHLFGGECGQGARAHPAAGDGAGGG